MHSEICTLLTNWIAEYTLIYILNAALNLSEGFICDDLQVNLFLCGPVGAF